MVKRHIGTMKQCFRAYCNEHKNWDEPIPESAFSMRAALSVATGFTSAPLCYGHELRTLWQPTEERHCMAASAIYLACSEAALRSATVSHDIGGRWPCAAWNPHTQRRCQGHLVKARTKAKWAIPHLQMSWSKYSSSPTHGPKKLVEKPMPRNSLNIILYGRQGGSFVLQRGTGVRTSIGIDRWVCGTPRMRLEQWTSLLRRQCVRGRCCGSK